MLEDAWECGYLSALAGSSEDDNPYDYDLETDKYGAWLRGFEYGAQKLD